MTEKPTWNKPAYPVGARVHISGEGRGAPEYGRVVESWWNKKMGCFDYYIAFFGPKPPSMIIPPPKPYVLRYLESSLQPGW